MLNRPKTKARMQKTATTPKLEPNHSTKSTMDKERSPAGTPTLNILKCSPISLPPCYLK